MLEAKAGLWNVVKTRHNGRIVSSIVFTVCLERLGKRREEFVSACIRKLGRALSACLNLLLIMHECEIVERDLNL